MIQFEQYNTHHYPTFILICCMPRNYQKLCVYLIILRLSIQRLSMVRFTILNGYQIAILVGLKPNLYMHI